MKIEGHAIVDEQGCYATADGQMPEELKIADDFAGLQAHLDEAAICVMGRTTHESIPNRRQRNRLVITTDPEAQPAEEHVTFIGPEDVHTWLERNIHGADDVVAVLGGAQVYGLFEKEGYDTFHLAVATGVEVEDGKPLLPEAENLEEVVKRLTKSSYDVLRTDYAPEPEQAFDPDFDQAFER